MLMRFWRAAREAQAPARRLLMAWAWLCFANYGVGGVVPTLYLLRLGYDTRFLGLTGGLGGLAYAVMALPAGLLGARFGSRRLLTFGLALILLGYLSIPLAEAAPAAHQGGMILGVVALINVGFSLFVVNQVPFLMAATNPSERNHIFSLQSALLPLAAFGGALLGGLLPGFFATLTGASLESVTPYRWSTYCVAIFLVPSFLTMLTSPQPTEDTFQPHSAAVGQPAPQRLIALMALITGLRMVSQMGLSSFFTVYLDTALAVAASGIGMVLGGVRLIAGALALGMPGLAARWGARRVVIYTTLAAALSLVLMAAWPTLPGAALGFLGVTAFLAVGDPAYAIYRQLLVAPLWRSVMSGASNMVGSVLGGGVAYAGGLLIAASGFGPFFALCAGLTALAAGLMAGAGPHVEEHILAPPASP